MKPMLVRAATLAAAVVSASVFAGVRVNEISAADPNGDWFELYNDSNEEVDLSGWKVTDKPDRTDKWRTLPNGTRIAAHGYLVVRCDGDRGLIAGEPHVDIGFSASGEAVGLAMPNGTLVSSFKFGEMDEDVSYGYASGGDVVLGSSAAAQARIGGGSWRSVTGGVGFYSSAGAFTCTQFNANISIANADDAEAVVADSSKRTGASVTKSYQTINFREGSYGSAYASTAVPFPGNDTIEQCRDNYVVVCEGLVDIPAAGWWTFDCGSDDGFRLYISGHGVDFFDEFTGWRAFSHDPYSTFNFPEAGTYSLKLVYYEVSGGAECDLTVAQGQYSSYDAGAFRLVGAADCPVKHAASLAAWGENLASDANGATRLDWKGDFTLASAPDASDVYELRLHVKDGFVAWVNGTEVARLNAPDSLSSTSVATGTRTDAEAAGELSYVIPNSALRAGANTLEIAGLRASADRECLVSPRVLKSGGEDTLWYFKTPTPGSANADEVYYAKTPKVTFSEKHGYKTAPFQLTITCAKEPTAEIRYTTDGTEPTTASTLYTGPITISHSVAIRASVPRAKSLKTREFAATYIFLDQMLAEGRSFDEQSGGFPANEAVNGQKILYGMDQGEVNLDRARIVSGFTNSIPTISLILDPACLFNASTGIYVNCSNKGITWERAVMVEQIDPVHGGDNEFTAPAGLRLRGLNSRSAWLPKHGFRLFFRDEYGESPLKFPLFGSEGAEKFKRVDLRCSQNYSWANMWDEGGVNPERETFIADTFERETQGAMGEPYTRSRFVNLFINGRYWGLYQTEERGDDHFGATYLGGKNEDYDAFTATDVKSGNAPGKTPLWQMAAKGFSNNADYLRAQGLGTDRTRNAGYPVYLNVTNLIVRTIIGHWAADGDSPYSTWSDWGGYPNNFFGIRNTTDASTGFVWLCHDGEHGLGMASAYYHKTGANNINNYSYDAQSNPVEWGWGFKNYEGVAHGTAVEEAEKNFNTHWLNAQLMANAEYRLTFADLVQKHLYGRGALSAAQAEARFRTRMAEIDSAVCCEAARWGQHGESWQEWKDACEYVISNFIRVRTPYLVAHYRNAGWLPSINAPTFSQDDGTALTGSTRLGVTGTGTIYYTTDGTDPRAWGGAVAAGAHSGSGSASIAGNGGELHVMARAYANGEWSALSEGTFHCTEAFNGLRLHSFYGSTVGDGDTGEWICLTNVSDSAVSLAGVSVIFGKDGEGEAQADAKCFVTLTGGSLAAHQSLTLRQEDYAGVGWTKIPNGALSLWLLDSAGGEIQTGRVDQNLFANADGGGAYLIAKSFDHALTSADWTESAVIYTPTDPPDDPPVNPPDDPPAVVHNGSTYQWKTGRTGNWTDANNWTIVAGDNPGLTGYPSATNDTFTFAANSSNDITVNGTFDFRTTGNALGAENATVVLRGTAGSASIRTPSLATFAGANVTLSGVSLAVTEQSLQVHDNASLTLTDGAYVSTRWEFSVIGENACATFGSGTSADLGTGGYPLNLRGTNAKVVIDNAVVNAGRLAFGYSNETHNNVELRFKGAAPQLNVSGASQMRRDSDNPPSIVYEIPAGGYARAPLKYVNEQGADTFFKTYNAIATKVTIAVDDASPFYAAAVANTAIPLVDWSVNTAGVNADGLALGALKYPADNEISYDNAASPQIVYAKIVTFADAPPVIVSNGTTYQWKAGRTGRWTDPDNWTAIAGEIPGAAGYPIANDKFTFVADSVNDVTVDGVFELGTSGNDIGLNGATVVFRGTAGRAAISVKSANTFAGSTITFDGVALTVTAERFVALADSTISLVNGASVTTNWEIGTAGANAVLSFGPGTTGRITGDYPLNVKGTNTKIIVDDATIYAGRFDWGYKDSVVGGEEMVIRGAAPRIEVRNKTEVRSPQSAASKITFVIPAAGWQTAPIVYVGTGSTKFANGMSAEPVHLALAPDSPYLLTGAAAADIPLIDWTPGFDTASLVFDATAKPAANYLAYGSTTPATQILAHITDIGGALEVPEASALTISDGTVTIAVSTRLTGYSYALAFSETLDGEYVVPDGTVWVPAEQAATLTMPKPSKATGFFKIFARPTE